MPPVIYVPKQQEAVEYGLDLLGVFLDFTQCDKQLSASEY